MPDTAGVLVPEVDPRTGAARSKATSRTSTYGRSAFVGDAFDVAAGATVKRNYKWPFKVDFAEGVLLNGTKKGDTARFLAAPDTNLNNVAAAYGRSSTILQNAIAIGDKKITFTPANLAAATVGNFIDLALIDAGWWEITVSEGATTEGPYLVTGYTRSSGEVTLGVAKVWAGEAGDEPANWTGFTNAFTTAATVKVTRVLAETVTLSGGSVPVVFGNYGLESAPLPADAHLQLVYTAVAAPNTTRSVNLVYHVYTGVVE